MREVVTQEDIMQRKGRRRAMWQMRNRQGCGYAAVFVEEKQIRQRRGIGAGDEVGQDKIAPVETYRSRKEKSNLFGESGEAS